MEEEVTADEVALDQQTIDHLRASGSDLSKPHKIEFYLYAPYEADATAASAVLQGLGYEVTVTLGADEINWLCLAERTMVPSIHALTDARRIFKNLAAKYMGDYDGWGTTVEE